MIKPNQLQLTTWAQNAQSALLDYAKCFRQLFTGPDRLPDQVEFTLGQLQLRAASTSDSVLNLIPELKLWDAEILLRTVIESSMKLTFICIGDEQEQQVRADEFLVILPEIAQLKRHRRAEDFLDLIPDREADQWRPIRDVLLSPQELEALGDRYPKVRRDRIEKKWGFTRIADELKKSDTEFQNLFALLYPYGMGSHSVHQDGDAILMMWEREQRSEEQIRAIELAHGAREISDVVTFAKIRARAAYRARQLDPSPVHNVTELYRPLFEEMRQAHHAFHAMEYLPTDANAASSPTFEGLHPEGQAIIRRSTEN